METTKKFAHCILNYKGAPVFGIVKFSQVEGGTRVQANIEGLPKGKHGFHVHIWGNLEGGCKSAGGHFNPFGKTHGGPGDEERHVGDMGNIESDGKVATLDYVDKLITLVGENTIIGRSVVIHEGEDDLGKGG